MEREIVAYNDDYGRNIGRRDRFNNVVMEREIVGHNDDYELNIGKRDKFNREPRWLEQCIQEYELQTHGSKLYCFLYRCIACTKTIFPIAHVNYVISERSLKP